MLTHTFTKTFAVLDAWASTVPHDRRNCADSCFKQHVHAWDLCAEPQCDEYLAPNEVCYAVTQLPKSWVCWRHVRPDEGPIRITP